MEVRQQKMVSRFGQVLTFLDSNASIIPADKVAAQRQTLETAITQITAFAQDQVVKGTESVVAQTKVSACTALRDTYMRQLSTVGQHSLMGKHAGDPNVPNAANIFALPKTHADALTLLTSARAMVAAATPYASIFTSFGVNFDAVNAAIQAVDAASSASDTAKRVSKGATQGIAAQIIAGQGAVRLLDVIVRPLIASNQSLVTQWKSVKRAAGGVNLSAPVPVPPAPPSATTSSPTPASTDTGSTTSSGSSPSTSTSASTASTASTASAAGPAQPAAPSAAAA